MRDSFFPTNFENRKSLFSAAAVVLIIVSLSGCSSTQQTAIDHSLTASEIIASVNAQADSILTFSAYGNVNVQTPTMNQGAGLDLLVKKPDSVRIVIEGPFGITVLKALFTKDHFIAYNALNNSVFEGDPSKGLKGFPMISSFPLEVLIDALSGVRRFNNVTAEPDSFYSNDKFYTMVVSGNETSSKFLIDPNSMRISNVTTHKSNGELFFEEQYSYRQLENGRWVPSTATIFVPQKQVTLDISFDEITINEAIESMLISVPEEADRTTIN